MGEGRALSSEEVDRLLTRAENAEQKVHELKRQVAEARDWDVREFAKAARADGLMLLHEDGWVVMTREQWNTVEQRAVEHAQRAEEAERQVAEAGETLATERELARGLLRDLLSMRERAEDAERQRDALRAVALIADSWGPFKEPLHTALVELARVWPTWRDTPPRVAEGEGT